MGITAFAHHFEVANAYGVTIYYLKTSDTEVAVSCKGSSSDLVYYNEYAGDVVIPKSVTYNGVTYSVTSIGEKAFCRCSGLTSIMIPNSVTSIENGAFCGCSGLTSVTVLNPTPVAITQYVFTNRLNATLYVPKGSRSAYEAADYWKEFKEIVEIDFIIPGDANSDGLVNVTDIVATVNIIMKGGTQNVREVMSVLRRSGFIFK